ncbi:hypothetical protein C8R43DRAFT_962890 [Mycena crocata]|nr:hypothetical protein C8R43DRAFT_962890 [Mycena crocata]
MQTSPKHIKLSWTRNGKKDIIIHNLGSAAMDEATVQTGTILLTMLSITDDDLQVAAPHLSALNLQKKYLIKNSAMKDFNNYLPPSNVLNVHCIGVTTFETIYSNIPLPVQLANKANAASAIKLLQLISALLHHKDGQRGYQDKTGIFMRERNMELYGLPEATSFPDVSNVQYGCYSYAAAEVVCFHGLIQELVEETMAGKTKSGQPNHIEKNILKGLNCEQTMEQPIANSLYGVTVSWVYMPMVSGTKENPVNMLSLTPLHRKLLVFCSHITSNPHILLDSMTPLSEFTLNGHMKYHPNSSVESFSNYTQTQHNNMEAFIKKLCDDAVEKFVMWEQEKAKKAVEHRCTSAAQKKAKQDHLAATSLELDIDKIKQLSSVLLKEQLHLYHDVLKDETLVKKLWKDMTTVAVVGFGSLRVGTCKTGSEGADPP